MRSKILYCATGLSLTLEACSSRPREFTPTPATLSGSPAAFDAAYTECHQLYASGNLNSAGKGGSAGVGAAAGATTAVVGGTTAAAMGGYAGLAAASATIVLLPFAIVGGAWGMSRMKRAKKESAMKASLTGCLKDRGYEVAGWSKAVKRPTVISPAPAK